MDLQVNGRCTKVFSTEYTSKKDGQKHLKNHFVLDVQDGQWQRSICFSVMDEERWSRMGIVMGGTYNVSFDVSSREYNGNYYTDVSAWRAVRVDNAQVQNAPTQTHAPVQSQQQAPQAVSGGYQRQQGSNDLPF